MVDHNPGNYNCFAGKFNKLCLCILSDSLVHYTILLLNTADSMNQM